MAAETAAELLLTGSIRPSPEAPATTALAVGGGRVLALGDDAERLATARTQRVDLEGGCVLPAFRDGHVHPMWGGVGLSHAPVVDATSVDQVLSIVRTYAEARPELDWVQGKAYLGSLLPDGVGSAQLLDTAVRDRPVVLTSNDGHAVWVNSEALRRAGIEAGTPEPALGQIVRHADGSPVGTLREWGAMDLVTRLLPAASDDEQLAGLLRGARHLTSVGLAFAQDAAVDADDVLVYRRAVLEGLLPVRAAVALRAVPGQWAQVLASWVQLRVDTEALLVEAGRLDRLSVRTVKFFADGVIESGTGALLDPYEDAPHSCGLPNWSAEELAEAVAAVDAAGFQAHIHAIGDAGVRMALDAVAHAQRENGDRDRRPVVAHTQVVHPDDLPRFAELGVVANFEPIWAQLDATMTEQTLPRLGAERGRQQYPIAGLQRRGTTLSFGSDWPVTSAAPLEGIAVALSRQTPDGQPAGGWTPHERVDLASALAAYTTGVA